MYPSTQRWSPLVQCSQQTNKFEPNLSLLTGPVRIHLTGERRAMKMASRRLELARWLEFLAFARMVKHFNRLGQTLSLHSADSFRCLVMPLSDLRISRAPSSEASSSYRKVVYKSRSLSASFQLFWCGFKYGLYSRAVNVLSLQIMQKRSGTSTVKEQHYQCYKIVSDVNRQWNEQNILHVSSVEIYPDINDIGQPF